MTHRIKGRDGAIIPLDCKFGSGIKDKNGHEIFEGDYLNIDFEGAAKKIGDGCLISRILGYRLKPNARLKVEFYLGRFWLVWKMDNNGSASDGSDVSDLDCIREFVEIVEEEQKWTA